MSADLFEVVATAFIIHNGHILLTRRAATKKRFPGLWTIPGGHLTQTDFTALPQTSQYWYGVLEIALRREIREETGITVTNIRPFENLATVHPDGAVLVCSFTASYQCGAVSLDQSEADAFAWVPRDKIHLYNLISGLAQEIARLPLKMLCQTELKEDRRAQ